MAEKSESETTVTWAHLKSVVALIIAIIAQTVGLTLMFQNSLNGIRDENNKERELYRVEMSELKRIVESNALIFEKKLSDIRTEQTGSFVRKDEYTGQMKDVNSSLTEITKSLSRLEGVLSVPTQQGGK